LAADSPDATNPAGHFLRISAARTAGLHPVRGEVQTSSPRSLIEQVRFNQSALPFEHGFAVGPEAGMLEIRFAAPASGMSDKMRYRLLGFDTEWKEAGKERAVFYYHLTPGRYEFDFQQAESGSMRGSVVESIPITVIAPYWQTAWFRSVCILLLMFLILIFYKLRVGYLVRHNRKLQEQVTQTKAELTLTAKVAGDAQEALKEQALKDSLTGLWNRGAIFAMLEREVCRAQRDKFPITLLMLDLDHFKNINDSYGHLTGDDVLRETAGRLMEVMRPYDFAGRYGGEEFLVVLPSCSPLNGIQRAEHFRRAIAERPVPTALGALSVTCSFGVAAYDGTMLPEDLIQRADEALYRAKRLGRNRVCGENQGTAANRR
jgi:diguanylate cyclase (GGDEF)-like protein